MKNLILIMIIICTTLIAQRKETSGFALKLSIDNDIKSDIVLNCSQNENGFLSGVVLGNDSLAFGVEKEIHTQYLNNFSENYWQQTGSIYTRPTHYSLEAAFAKKIVFSIYPKRMLSDTILVYCKYITYSLRKSARESKEEYEISYNEEFLKAEINQEIKPPFLSIHFPNSKINYLITTDGEITKNEIVDKSPYPLDPERLISFAKKSQISLNDFMIGIEFVRTTKNGNQILLKRTDFPLKGFGVSIDQDTKTKKNLYYGYIEVPFHIYNPKKNDLFLQSKLVSSKTYYTVYMVPLNKEKNGYNIEVIISRGDVTGHYAYSKKVVLNIGEKINVELQPMNWRYTEVVMGEMMEVNSEEDYSKFVKDHLIISLEDIKINKEEVPVITNNTTISGSESNSKSDESYYSRILRYELLELAKHAVKQSYENDESLINWNIPNDRTKGFKGIYRKRIIDDGIEIEGEIITLGEEKFTSEKAKISVTNENKITHYKVRRGETFNSIASKFRISVSELKNRNNLKTNRPFVNQTLKIPNKSQRQNLIISPVEIIK